MDSTLFRQILDEASFLWFQRNHAADSEYFNLDSLVQIDRRLAGLFRLLPSSPDIINAANEKFDPEDPDKFYCLVIAAAAKAEIDLFQLIEKALQEEASEQDIISSLSWVDYSIIEPLLHKLYNSNQIQLQYIALETWRLQRKKPNIDIIAAINSDDTKVASSAIRMVGELAIEDFHKQVEDKLAYKDTTVRFWASYSCALLGNIKGVSNLIESIKDMARPNETAINTGFATLEVEQATSWINHLTVSDVLPQKIIKCFEILGNTKFIPWLVSMTQKQPTAPFASHAFCTITGMSLFSEDHGDLLPILADTGAIESDDYKDLWEQLPHSGFSDWWNDNMENFHPEKRYFSGKEVNEDNLKFVWLKGNQKQRERAALELALATPSSPLFEHKAPGFRQC